MLQCRLCKRQFEIAGSIPRFVALQNYAHSFGFQWKIHSNTQYDSYTGTRISEERFFGETKWPKRLDGQTILEVGCGSGRFTEQAASTGAMVVSMDYSHSVESAYAHNGHKDNVLIVQADMYQMPFKENVFDKVFCFGVLQHTPNVQNAFRALCRHLKCGGSLVIDVYPKYGDPRDWLITKYWVRPLTKRVSPDRLYRWCKGYVHFMWPVARVINKIPYFGRRLNLRLLIADYRGVYPLGEELLKEWAVLDTFDMLSPMYDSPQRIEAVKEWFRQAGMTNVEVNYGYNGIEARGIKAG